ncbi:MAG: ABC transporter permease [Firmicutes bacterium]|nr:ABC transporter permease [Bacillota bacterium]
MLNIARLTFMEVSRKKIFMVTIVLSLIFLLLYGVTLERAAEDMARMKDMGGQQMVIQQVIGSQLLGLGLYFASMLLALLSLMASVGSVASEVESGLLHAIVSKPIKRSDIILGKYFGYGLMLSSYALVLFSGVMAINYAYNANVLSLLTKPLLVYGALLFALQPMILLGVAMVFSTLTRTLTAGIISFTLYGLGMVGGFLEQIGGMISKSSLITIGIVTSLVIPSDALFRKVVSIINGNQENPFSALAAAPFGVTVPPSNAMLVYTGIYICGCILLSIYNFKKRDL